MTSSPFPPSPTPTRQPSSYKRLTTRITCSRSSRPARIRPSYQYLVNLDRSLIIQGGAGDDEIILVGALTVPQIESTLVTATTRSRSASALTTGIGPVLLDGGTGKNSVTVDDRADIDIFAYTVTNSTVTRNGGFGGLTYTNVAKLTVDSDRRISGPFSTVNVESTSNATPVTIAASGGGYYNVNVGKAGSTLAILGDVTLTTFGNNRAALNVNASADWGGTITLANSKIEGAAPATISYPPTGLTP